MCNPVRCRVCAKTTWSGCGEHIDAVKARVAPDQWCDGHAPAQEPTARRWTRR